MQIVNQLQLKMSKKRKLEFYRKIFFDISREKIERRKMKFETEDGSDEEEEDDDEEEDDGEVRIKFIKLKKRCIFYFHFRNLNKKNLVG